jgi:hypothetical protein
MHLPQPIEGDADRVHLRFEAVLDAFRSISKDNLMHHQWRDPIKKLEPDAGKRWGLCGAALCMLSYTVCCRELISIKP